MPKKIFISIAVLTLFPFYGCVTPNSKSFREISPIPDITQTLNWDIQTHGADAAPLFAALRRKGVHIVRLDGPAFPVWVVPAAMRHQTVRAHALIAAVAEYHGFTVQWWRGRETVAVFQRPVEEPRVQSLLAALADPGDATRTAAAWRAIWTPDARLIPALLETAANTGNASARQALKTLYGYGWEAVLALDERRALEVLDLNFDPIAFQQAEVGKALANAGTPEALALVRRLVENRDYNAVPALGRINAESAWNLLEKVAEKDGSIEPVVGALDLAGGPRAVKLLKKIIARNPSFDHVTFPVLGRVWGKDGIPYFKTMLAGGRRVGALMALGEVGGPEAFAIVADYAETMKFERHEDAWPNLTAATVCGHLAANDPNLRPRALAILEKMFDLYGWLYTEQLKERVAQALAEIGPEGLPLLTKFAQTKTFVLVFDSGYRPVESAIAQALGDIGGPGTWEMINAAGRIPQVERAYLTALALTGRDVVPQFAACLTGPDHYSQLTEVYYLEHRQAVALFNRLVSAPAPLIRSTAVYPIAVSGNTATADAIRKLAKDTEVSVRAEMAEHLSRVRGTHAPVLIAELLPRLCRDRVGNVRDSAMSVVACLPEEAALPYLRAGLQDADDRVRHAAMLASAKVGGDGALRLMEKAMFGKNGEDGQAWVEAVFAFDLPAATALVARVFAGNNQALLEAVKDEANRWRCYKALMVYSETLKDANPRVRLQSLWALARFDRPESLPLFRAAMDDPDLEVARVATQLYVLKPAADVAVLRPLFLSAGPRNEALAMHALTFMPEDRAAGFLRELWPKLDPPGQARVIAGLRAGDQARDVFLESALGITPAPDGDGRDPNHANNPRRLHE